MKLRGFLFWSVFWTVVGQSLALAELRDLRWTSKDAVGPDLSPILEQINQELGTGLGVWDYVLLEDRDLATSHFQMWTQVSQDLPIQGAAVRIWTDRETGASLQIEARVETQPMPSARFLARPQLRIRSQETAQKAILKSLQTKKFEGDTDAAIRSLKTQDEWRDQEPIRVARIRARRGEHTIVASLRTGRIVSHTYRPFSKADGLRIVNGEYTLPAQVFPIYEETYEEQKLQPRVSAELRYLKSEAPRVTEDPYASLRSTNYYFSKFDPLLAQFDLGRQQGYWSSAELKALGDSLREYLPVASNTFSSGVVLEGRYATVSLHPDVASLSGLNFKPEMSASLHFRFKDALNNGMPDYELVPGASLLGRPILSISDVWNRPAVKDPQNNPARYINDGFDEIQVYYAITRLFDSLHAMGFTDPELSTRAFHAFLYDPDIAMRDNAYYADDTINFTTYTPGTPNMARDNPTIWHELGHGVMDRLMGQWITLSDTGGLSEGLADFIAALVLDDVTSSAPFEGEQDFRILNRIGFNLTNEVHDDGEAYGGVMYDVMKAAIAREGKVGLYKVADLTLEAMRLTRNHPGLTANDWFNHMLFADELGRSGVRIPGELSPLILQALASRNFSLTGEAVAEFSLRVNGAEVTATAPGSRDAPITVRIAPWETYATDLAVSFRGTAVYPFNGPMTVRAYFESGPLQGAIDWRGATQEPLEFAITQEGQDVRIPLQVSGNCDEVNRPDGSCVDYVYLQLMDPSRSTDKPIAKKRFYLRIRN